MAFAFIVSAAAAAAGASSPATTSAIDTSGANLIVCKASYNWNGSGGAGLTDSKSNTWTPLTEYGAAITGVTTTRLFYSYAPTVGSGHTFEFDFGTLGYVNLQVLAFSGSASSPFDQDNGNNGVTDTEVQTGSVTPSQDNELLVAGASVFWGGATDITSVNSSFTLQEVTGYATSNNFGGAIAYQIQTTATARNPIFFWDGGAEIACAAIATFTAASTAGSPWNYYAQQ